MWDSRYDLGQTTEGSNFAASQRFTQYTAAASLHSRRRRFCGEILNLARAEREAYPPVDSYPVQQCLRGEGLVLPVMATPAP